MQKSNRGGNAATEAEAPVYLFNTMEVLKMLEEAGVPRAQAEAQAAAMHVALSGSVATKADLKLLEVKMDAGFEALDSKMDAGFKAMRETMATKSDLQVLEGKVETMATKADLSEMKVDLMKWFFRSLIAVSAVNVAAVGILVAVLV